LHGLVSNAHSQIALLAQPKTFGANKLMFPSTSPSLFVSRRV
jgi:hypothetical protein